MIKTCIINTPLGAMRAAAEHEALTGLWFVGQKYYPQNTDAWIEKPDLFCLLQGWLQVYFEGKNPELSLTLCPQGTAFQQRVWHILQQIPYGKTLTYGEIAKQIRGSAQAVGGAVGRNPISLLIPCHRVIGYDGSLTGYAGGIEKKKALLELETKIVAASP